MAFIYSLTDTWNDAGVTFTGIGLNVTDSASNAASNLMNLQVGGTSRFNVGKSGGVTVYGNVSPSAGNSWTLGNVGAGLEFLSVSARSVQVGTSGGFAALTFDAADILAQRRTTNAQTFRVYNTFTDASNYERISFGWSANVFTIGRESAGTGVARNMQLVGGGSVLGIGPAASAAVDWTFSAGNLLAGTDNTRDIGASGASRPRNLYMASWIRMATTTVASLPAAATAGAGARMFVTDASTPTFGSAVVGGGAVTVPVYSTGSAWNVG